MLLGQTIALDLKGTWWTKWWHKRRGYRNFATEFADMIQAETDPIVEALRGAHSEAVRDAALAVLDDFMNEQRGMLQRIADEARQQPAGVNNLLDESSAAVKRAELKETMQVLTGFAA